VSNPVWVLRRPYTSTIMMNPRSLALTLSLLACLVARPASAQTTMVCDSSVLPAAARDLLALKFSQWRPKVVSDMDTDDQQLWLSATKGKACPGLVSGHFETPDKASYALLLVPKSNADAGYKVIVLSQRGADDSYDWRLVDHADAPANVGIVISKVPPEKYSDWENNKSIQLKLDGLQVEWMEKGAFVYYWSAGHYRRIQVSD
jgi:hypothetical protein